MAALSEHDPPASYILTYAEYMGRPCQTLLQDDDLLLIGMAPVHPDPDLAKKEELLSLQRTPRNAGSIERQSPELGS
jgi:hypothetical protein